MDMYVDNVLYSVVTMNKTAGRVCEFILLCHLMSCQQFTNVTNYLYDELTACVEQTKLMHSHINKPVYFSDPK